MNSAIKRGIVIGLVGLVVGIMAIVCAADNKMLFSGICLTLAGAGFLGYSVFGVFYTRRARH